MTDKSRPAGYAMRAEYEVSCAEAKRLLDAGEAILLDCRTDDEWELVHVEGATHLPMHEIERRHDEIEGDKETRVLVMCHHGVRSLKVTLALQQLGFPEARSVVGGIDRWAEVVDPGVARYERGHGGCRLI